MNATKGAALLAAALLAGSAARADAVSVPDSLAVRERISPGDPFPERPIDWSRPDVTLTDVVYATIPGYRPLHLDLYRPSNSSGSRPLVVYVHGGGWAQANPRVGAAFADFPAVLASLVERGYVVASISHRMSGEAAFPAQLDDLRAALGFLRGNAARFGIDPARVGLWGMSSGAHLAALAAFDCSTGTCVQALVGWFGPYDLAAQARHERSESVRTLLRCGEGDCRPESLAAASPITFIDKDDPPVLFVHGSADRLVPVSQSQVMAERLRASGGKVELLVIDGVDHGLVGPIPPDTRRALRQALEATAVFLDRQLLTPQR